MHQQEGEAAGAAQRQGDVRRWGHRFQQEDQFYIQAAVPVRAGVSTGGDCRSSSSLFLTRLFPLRRSVLS
jgi:hypothetical protein